jgi:hypothetical protein
MTKYMILHNSAQSAKEVMSSASAEEKQKAMQEWLQWREDAKKVAKLEFGLPLQPVVRITQDGVEDSVTKVSGYATVEAESREDLIELLKTHPHMKRADTSIDLLEMIPLDKM